jgi:nucleotide-binding universal stress UspA family protein
MKILLAVDGSEYSNSAIDAVAERPWPEDSVVEIVCAADPPAVSIPETWLMPNRLYMRAGWTESEQAKTVVKDAIRRLMAGRKAELETVTKTITGHAPDVILGEAVRWDADLIVLGSHGYRGLKRLSLGSVSQAVAMHAPCSVEIVRHEAA